MTAPKRVEIALVSTEEPERTRVCGIVCIPNEAHQAQCVRAWKWRQHPQWSQFYPDVREVSRPKLRKVTNG